MEFIHRDNGAVAKGKGPSKPSDFYTVADSFIVNRIQKFHAHALDKRCSRRDAFRFKNHPRVKQTIQKLKGSSKRQGVGGNPKLFYLNQVRTSLRDQGLNKEEFNIEVGRAAGRYDLREA